MSTPFTIKKEICDIGKLLYQRGMLAGTDGNISVKLDDDRIMITPSGVAKGRMSPDEMVIVDINGKHLQGSNKASSEMLMHLAVYKARPEIKYCVQSLNRYGVNFISAKYLPCCIQKQSKNIKIILKQSKT